MEHRLSGKGCERLAQSRSRCRWRAVAVPVAAGLGAHQPDRRLPLAQQRQGRFGEVQAATVAAKALTYFKFRFLRRPQVAEGTGAGSEIVESEGEAHFLALADEPRRRFEIVDRHGLGQLETDGVPAQLVLLRLLPDVREDLLAVDRGAGQVDGTGERLATALRDDPAIAAEHLVNHPAIDLRHQAVALGRRQEVPGRDDLSLLPDHAQQDFQMLVVPGLEVQGPVGLVVEHEAVFREGRVDPRHPARFAAPGGQIHVAGLVDADAIAALFLGPIAGAIGFRDNLGDVEVIRRDGRQADAGPDREAFRFPDEVEIPDRRHDFLGNQLAAPGFAADQEQGEFVAAQPGQRVGFADPRLDQPGQADEQLVAGGVAAGVIDHFEVVQIQEADHMRPPAGPGILGGRLHAVLQFAPVDQPRQRIVIGLPRASPEVLAHLADVAQGHDAPHDLSFLIEDRSGTFFDGQRRAVRPQQFHVVRAGRRAALVQRAVQGGFERLPGGAVDQGNHLRERLPAHLVQTSPEQRLGRGIEVLDMALGIGADHAVGDRMQGNLRALLFLEQSVRRPP